MTTIQVAHLLNVFVHAISFLTIAMFLTGAAVIGSSSVTVFMGVCLFINGVCFSRAVDKAYDLLKETTNA